MTPVKMNESTYYVIHQTVKIKNMKKFLLPIFAITLFGCPANPKIIQIETGNERQMTCPQLQDEIAAAKQAKIDAHAEDNFRFGNIFPPTGAISVSNIWRADSHATRRLELLNNIAHEKGCGGF
jgi:hypothetical protein